MLECTARLEKNFGLHVDFFVETHIDLGTSLFIFSTFLYFNFVVVFAVVCSIN